MKDHIQMLVLQCSNEDDKGIRKIPILSILNVTLISTIHFTDTDLVHFGYMKPIQNFPLNVENCRLFSINMMEYEQILLVNGMPPDASTDILVTTNNTVTSNCVMCTSGQ